MIRRMLCPDPRTRITVPEIMAHPWFCTDLPAGVTDLNETLLATAAAAEVDAYDAAGLEGTVRPPCQLLNVANQYEFDSQLFISSQLQSRMT